MSFDLLLAERFGQWVCHIQRGVDSLHLDELLLEVFTYDVKLSLYVFGLLMRSELFSESYGTVVVAVQCNGITPSSTINFLNQKASLAALEAAMYSAFMVKLVMIDCLKFFQLIESPLYRNMHPNVDLLSSILDMKSESVYPFTFSFDPPSKIKNKFLVLLKYLRMFFTII